MKTSQKRSTLETVLLTSGLLIPLASGAGFQLTERSASGLGRAFSGEAAIAEDASVLSSNPAALILLGGEWNFSVGVTYINPSADATLFPLVTGGNNGPALRDDDIAEDAFVPYLYLTKKITDDLSVGFGAFSTFGFRTNYSEAVADQINTNFSEIATFTLNPSFGYRINDFLSVGAGFNALYAEGEITSNAVAGTPLPFFGLEGDDWAFGYNIGLLFEPTSTTRIGLNYRSKFDIDLEGSSNSFFSGGTSVPADLSIELPATLQVSIAQDLSPQWTIHGDILWTQWSSFDRLEPNTGSPATDPFLAVDQEWNDTFRYSIGATYRPNSTWTLRTGIAYDESPIDDEFRTLRIPDGDRFWLSAGASYAINPNLSIDAGYSLIFIQDVSLGENDPSIDTDSLGEGIIQQFSLGLSGSF